MTIEAIILKRIDTAEYILELAKGYKYWCSLLGNCNLQNWMTTIIIYGREIHLLTWTPIMSELFWHWQNMVYLKIILSEIYQGRACLLLRCIHILKITQVSLKEILLLSIVSLLPILQVIKHR